MGIPELTPEILEAMEVVFTYIGQENDWMTFKKELLKNLRPDQRSLFSTRDPKTKAQTLNDLEKEVVSHWHLKTGVLLVLKT